MAQLLAAQDTEVLVAYSMFAMLSGGGGDPLADQQEIAAIGPGGIGFFSAANDHTATVRLECWDGEPPADASGGETVTGALAIAPSGAVALVGITTGFSLEIPTPFTGPCRAEVVCTGRDEAARLYNEEHELFFDDVERWLVRLWPDEHRNQ
ncbi:hypothetical protein [Amycolatopsis circi]|uniref:hypothetical protein n=1 Tax=Amycolatopsis circi TaxID=871959 RepID=UPI000E23611D|nr:hypothetical protein [Amycolatopsis circi]